MPSITVSRHIEAPIDVVFPLFLDLEHAAEHIRGITRLELLTVGPVRVGTRFRETRLMFGREGTEEMEVTAIEPGRGYTVEATNHGAHYVTTFAMTPVGDDATEVVMEFRGIPRSFVARILSWLTGFLAGPIRKCMSDDLDDLKAVAERRVAQP